MNNFFSLLLLASLLFLVIGIFSPATSLFWNKEKRTRKKSMLIYGGLTIIFFILFGATSDIAKEEKQDGQKNVNQPVVSSIADNSTSSDNQKTEGSLFNSTEEFTTAFNQYCASSHLDFRINSLKIEQGEVYNTFRYMLNNNLGLTGTIIKSNGGLKEINMIGTGDGTTTSGHNIFLCMLAIITTVDPTIPVESRIKILKKLKMIGDKSVDVTNMSQETIMNGIKYTINSHPKMGLWFTASTNTDLD